MAGMSVAWSNNLNSDTNEISSDIVMGLPTTLMFAGNIVESRKIETKVETFFSSDTDFETDFNFETWIASPTRNTDKDEYCRNDEIYNSTTGLRCNRYSGTSIITAQFSKSKKLYIVGGLLSAAVKFYEKTPFNT